MPYEKGTIFVIVGLLVVFGTFAWLVVNARAVMMLFRGGDSEVVAGPGNPRKTPSRSTTWAMLIFHFVGWAIVGIASLWMLADVRATAPDTTPLEATKNTSR